ncbi:MAG: 30S ribosomal protein S12 methylthiotransferase RimO [Verrucomicrobiae bacterium]|nr:30S ribosomal protein S12 methylthiotransferase RimO [Verrucomicrobiae bacterium]
MSELVATGAPSVGLVSLGCAKNLVDAEIMLGALLGAGLRVTNDPAAADVLIINTCSFIDAAQEESVDTILEYAAQRERERPAQGLIVAGCLPQRHREELPRLLPEVDVFMGVDQVAQVAELVRQALRHRAAQLAAAPRRANRQALLARLAELGAGAGGGSGEGAPDLRGRARNQTRVTLSAPPPPEVQVHLRPRYIPDYATPRLRLTPRHFAYVKIAEGCNHPCSFCIIPRLRGSYRSRPLGDVVREARQLVAEGCRELNLISQDTTYYGRDWRRGAAAAQEEAPTLCTLLRALNEVEGDFWIRLLYTHPAHWTEELIRTVAECPKVVRYADMPLQHIHDVMLERMRRETSRAYIEDLVGKIRAGIPGIALRTTFIVGFPGETEARFAALVEFVRRVRFERLGVFAYSREAGTRAAQMRGQVPAAERQRRRELLMAAQHEVAREVAAGFVGRRLRVLVEGEATARQLREARVDSWEHGLLREADGGAQRLRGRYAVARGEADAPDIDGRVYIRGGAARAGEFAEVRVVGHTDYDLLAELAGSGSGT